MKYKTNNKGFTILELLIVLGIAGAILLVVLVAIPALQRNSKNTAYRQEVARLLAGVSEYTTNNNGIIPKTSEEFEDAAELANLAEINRFDVGTGTTSITPWTDPSKVVIRTGARCNPTVADITTPVSGSGRQIAFYYVIEGSDGSTNIIQCAQS